MYQMLFAAIGTVALLIGPAYGDCRKPMAPACAISGSFASKTDWDTCRYLMLFYKMNMETLAKCRRDEGGDEQGVYAEFEGVLLDFTRRSRELPAQHGPEEEDNEPEK